MASKRTDRNWSHCHTPEHRKPSETPFYMCLGNKCQRDVEDWIPHTGWCVCKMVPLFEKTCSPSEPHPELSYDPAILLLGAHTEKNESLNVHPHSAMFSAALLIINEKLKGKKKP